MRRIWPTVAVALAVALAAALAWLTLTCCKPKQVDHQTSFDKQIYKAESEQFNFELIDIDRLPQTYSTLEWRDTNSEQLLLFKDGLVDNSTPAGFNGSVKLVLIRDNNANYPLVLNLPVLGENVYFLSQSRLLWISKGCDAERGIYPVIAIDFGDTVGGVFYNRGWSYFVCGD